MVDAETDDEDLLDDTTEVEKSPTVEDHIGDGLESCIGDTPLFRIKSLSEETGCEILGKAEFMNQGGSVKDRVALGMIKTVGLRSNTSIMQRLQGMEKLMRAIEAGRTARSADSKLWRCHLRRHSWFDWDIACDGV